MIADRNYITERGLLNLRAELRRLEQEERVELIERLAEVTTGGDWMDSGERTLVEAELAFVEGRIRELQRILATAEIIPPDSDPSRVDLGDTVVLMSADGYETYTIVGSAETDPGSGFISYDSPLGKSLLRHKAGDEVLVHAPAGDLRFRVVEVRVPVWE